MISTAILGFLGTLIPNIILSTTYSIFCYSDNAGEHEFLGKIITISNKLCMECYSDGETTRYKYMVISLQ